MELLHQDLEGTSHSELPEKLVKTKFEAEVFTFAILCEKLSFRRRSSSIDIAIAIL